MKTQNINQMQTAIITKSGKILDPQQMHVCRLCDKLLSSSSSLDRHMLTHSGERPFVCKRCHMTFTTNGNMHRHMRTHLHKDSLARQQQEQMQLKQSLLIGGAAAAAAAAADLSQQRHQLATGALNSTATQFGPGTLQPSGSPAGFYPGAQTTNAQANASGTGQSVLSGPTLASLIAGNVSALTAHNSASTKGPGQHPHGHHLQHHNNNNLQHSSHQSNPVAALLNQQLLTAALQHQQQLQHRQVLTSGLGREKQFDAVQRATNNNHQEVSTTTTSASSAPQYQQLHEQQQQQAQSNISVSPSATASPSPAAATAAQLFKSHHKALKAGNHNHQMMHSNQAIAAGSLEHIDPKTFMMSAALAAANHQQQDSQASLESVKAVMLAAAAAAAAAAMGGQGSTNVSTNQKPQNGHQPLAINESVLGEAGAASSNLLMELPQDYQHANKPRLANSSSRPGGKRRKQVNPLRSHQLDAVSVSASESPNGSISSQVAANFSCSGGILAEASRNDSFSASDEDDFDDFCEQNGIDDDIRRQLLAGQRNSGSGSNDFLEGQFEFNSRIEQSALVGKGARQRLRANVIKNERERFSPAEDFNNNNQSATTSSVSALDEQRENINMSSRGGHTNDNDAEVGAEADEAPEFRTTNDEALNLQSPLAGSNSSSPDLVDRGARVLRANQSRCQQVGHGNQEAPDAPNRRSCRVEKASHSLLSLERMSSDIGSRDEERPNENNNNDNDNNNNNNSRGQIESRKPSQEETFERQMKRETEPQAYNETDLINQPRLRSAYNREDQSESAAPSVVQSNHHLAHVSRDSFDRDQSSCSESISSSSLVARFAQGDSHDTGGLSSSFVTSSLLETALNEDNRNRGCDEADHDDNDEDSYLIDQNSDHTQHHHLNSAADQINKSSLFGQLDALSDGAENDVDIGEEGDVGDNNDYADVDDSAHKANTQTQQNTVRHSTKQAQANTSTTNNFNNLAQKSEVGDDEEDDEIVEDISQSYVKTANPNATRKGGKRNRHCYKCKLCTYSSVDRCTLVRHLRIHSGERPYICGICRYAFTTKANCERHVRKRHKKQYNSLGGSGGVKGSNGGGRSLIITDHSNHQTIPVKVNPVAAQTISQTLQRIQEKEQQQQQQSADGVELIDSNRRTRATAENNDNIERINNRVGGNRCSSGKRKQCPSDTQDQIETDSEQMQAFQRRRLNNKQQKATGFQMSNAFGLQESITKDLFAAAAAASNPLGPATTTANVGKYLHQGDYYLDATPTSNQTSGPNFMSVATTTTYSGSGSEPEPANNSQQTSELFANLLVQIQQITNISNQRDLTNNSPQLTIQQQPDAALPTNTSVSTTRAESPTNSISNAAFLANMLGKAMTSDTTTVQRQQPASLAEQLNSLLSSKHLSQQLRNLNLQNPIFNKRTPFDQLSSLDFAQALDLSCKLQTHK